MRGVPCCNRSQKTPVAAQKRESAAERRRKGSDRLTQRRRRAAEGGDEVGERCAAVIRTSLGCCMRCAQSAAGESPPNPKVQHVHYDTGPRDTVNCRACGCCGAPARKRPVPQISRRFCTQDVLEKRDNDSPPPTTRWACRACVYSSTNDPTVRSGMYPRGKSVHTRRSQPTRKRVGVAVRRPSRVRCKA